MSDVYIVVVLCEVEVCFSDDVYLYLLVYRRYRLMPFVTMMLLLLYVFVAFIYICILAMAWIGKLVTKAYALMPRFNWQLAMGAEALGTTCMCSCRVSLYVA